MNRQNQAALAATLKTRWNQARSDNPNPTPLDLIWRTVLGCYANVIEASPDDRPIIRAAARCPQHEGEVLLGPEATAVLDGLLEGTLDSLTFVDALTGALATDSAEAPTPIPGGRS